MSYFKRISNFAIIIILFVLLLFLFGCGKDNNSPDNSYEALQVFAASQEETDPPLEIITGLISLTQPEKTTSVTTTVSVTESVENIENTNPAELYVITQSGKKYHYETCRTVKSIKQHLTKEEAEQMGYEPCKICKPQ